MRTKCSLVAFICLSVVYLNFPDHAIALPIDSPCPVSLTSVGPVELSNFNRYLLSPETLEKNREDWRWFGIHQGDLATSMHPAAGTAFRGMKLSPAQLQRILREGLDPADSSFAVLNFAGDPTFALHYAVIPGFNDPQTATGVLGVMFQVNISGLKAANTGAGSRVDERVESKRLIHLWIYNPHESDPKKRFEELKLR